jgi:hypothetical protein
MNNPENQYWVLLSKSLLISKNRMTPMELKAIQLQEKYTTQQLNQATLLRSKIGHYPNMPLK